MKQAPISMQLPISRRPGIRINLVCVHAAPLTTTQWRRLAERGEADVVDVDGWRCYQWMDGRRLRRKDAYVSPSAISRHRQHGEDRHAGGTGRHRCSCACWQRQGDQLVPAAVAVGSKSLEPGQRLQRTARRTDGAVHLAHACSTAGWPPSFVRWWLYLHQSHET